MQDKGNCMKFIKILKDLSFNIPLLEALEQILGYDKFMKELVTKKLTASF